MSELNFHPVTLEDYDVVWKYMSKHGEGSCQHSFVTMFSLYEKYGDAICEQDGFLYVLREHLCHDDVRVYLAPMGDGDRKAAFEKILEDAHSHHAVAEFQTLTETASRFLEEHFPGKFKMTESRDYAEYIYSTEKIATFSGAKLRNKRTEINRFYREYGDRVSVTGIRKEDFPEILDFEKKWLWQNREDHDSCALEREARAINLQLENYDALHLSGIVVRIDGIVHGYGYGTPLSDSYYDALIEKGDREIPNIYRVLFQESVKQCALSHTYVNREEDVGVMGLREVKLSYQPEILLKKYIVRENL